MTGGLTIESERVLRAVADVVREHGAQGWLVGGSVRDRELGRPSPDIDVVVTGDARAISNGVAHRLGVPWFTLSDEFRAYRIVGGTAHVDVAAVRGGDVLADLGERDFTVNAMATALDEGGVLGPLIDPFAGLADLRARRLRAVSERIFTDDPLRLMRAVRFAHVFGMGFDPGLKAAVRRQAGEIRDAAPERILTEMVLTLDAGRAGDAARLWVGSGLLQALLPDIQGMDADALFSSLDRLESILAGRSSGSSWGGGALEARMAEPVDGAFNRATALRLAALLRTCDPDGVTRVARRLRLSGAMLSLVVTVVRTARRGKPPTVPSTGALGREVVAFLWAAAPWEPEVVLLAAAAEEAGEVETAGLLDAWGARSTSGVPALPFDGHDLMRELGLAPGPHLGRALRAARLAWEAGEAVTAAQALAVARAALVRS